ncbi:hypothetical protein DXH78_08820 [Undibacter mobilis]|uniref:Uncharacterized protein n=2 Tax=Undibacter mobilis TaxID=2292256 RepID=A0A371BAK5_9BRAD|nr:hypothetical protein DXH78_08820 [Undibacter mobilis]
MLPIFRIISVGGVFLAIAILALALVPPGSTRLVVAQQDITARGPLMDPGQHPEWRQFLIQSALRRAGEIERLRELRDTVVRPPAAPEAGAADEMTVTAAAPRVVIRPGALDDDQPEDPTGSIGGHGGATIPIEIGETSSTELPVIGIEETPPVIRMPALQMPMNDQDTPATPPAPSAAKEISKKPEVSRRVVHQRARRKPPAPEPPSIPPPFNILAAFFGSFAKAEAPAQTSASSGRAATTSPASRQASRARAVTQ